MDHDDRSENKDISCFLYAHRCQRLVDIHQIKANSALRFNYAISNCQAC